MPISATTARTYINIPDAHTQTQTALDTTYQAIRDNKIRTVRIHAPWATIQPLNPTTYTWVGLDRAVNRALLKGLGVIIVITQPTPTWWENSRYDERLYGSYAKAVANRYRPGGGRGITRTNRPKGVAVFQIWDTPNSNYTSTYLLPARYAKLLKAAYPAIKSVQKDATVILGALESARSRALGNSRAIDQNQYLRALYLNGCRRFFDAAAFNPLSVATLQTTNPPPPSATIAAQSDEIRRIMRINGDKDKKIHWSTIGYDTDQYTELEQALHLETMRRLAEARNDHIAGIGIYTWQDPAEGS